MGFPETEYGTHYGQPSYKSFGKFLTRLRSEDDSIVIGGVSFDERDLLCEAEPETFFFTDHYRAYPYVLARRERMTPARLRKYLERVWRANAPKAWLKAWEAGDPLPGVKPPPPRKRRKS